MSSGAMMRILSEPGRSGRLSGALALLTGVTMLAFAANSLLARMAFQTTAIDAALFTAIRISTGAVALLAILAAQGERLRLSGAGPISAALLFVYAASFSFAYRDIDTGTGALLLFAAAQITMIGYGLWKGERASLLGLGLALGGLVVFLAPGASAPPWGAAALMALSGLAWGGFSLFGKASESPVVSTATSFLLAVPLSLLLLFLRRDGLSFDPRGMIYAAISGSLTSGVGYAVWYWARSRMAAISAGAVQLSVPILSALLGVMVLGETLTLKGALAALAVLGGVALVTLTTKRG